MISHVYGKTMGSESFKNALHSLTSKATLQADNL